MLISETNTIDGARIAHSIGSLKAAALHRVAGRAEIDAATRAQILREIVRRAEDVDADAIVCLAFHVEPAAGANEAGIELACIRAEGLAVRIARTA